MGEGYHHLHQTHHSREQNVATYVLTVLNEKVFYKKGTNERREEASPQKLLAKHASTLSLSFSLAPNREKFPPGRHPKSVHGIRHASCLRNRERLRNRQRLRFWNRLRHCQSTGRNQGPNRYNIVPWVYRLLPLRTSIVHSHNHAPILCI